MADLPKDALINRRQFLRVVGFAAGSIALAPFLSASRPVDDSYTGKSSQLYRGTNDGKLLVSADGRNWSTAANFGPNLEVSKVVTSSDGWVHATLVLGGNSFVLKSRDQRVWYTQDYVSPIQA